MANADGLYAYVGATGPVAYEWLNRCTDPDQRIEAEMWKLAPLAGNVLVDIGAGSGFHAMRYAAEARQVLAVEPDARLVALARRRARKERLQNVVPVAAKADHLPLANRSVDIVCARFAYFFGTADCLPGMSELKRVLRAGGHAFIIDADPDRGDMGALARRAYPAAFPPDYTRRNRAFYRGLGFTPYPIETWFEAPTREILAQVFKMDYPHCHKELLAKVKGTTLSYGVMLYHYAA